jgi:hypothetical protein
MTRKLRLFGACAAALAVALSACTPASRPVATATAIAVAVAAPVPSEAMEMQWKDCTWGEVRASGVSLWAYACANDRMVGDETVPGFVRETGTNRATSIRFFTKAADAPIEAALPAIRAASPGGEACVLDFVAGRELRYQLVPTGAAAAAYEAFTSGRNPNGPSMPCGPLGPSEGGMRVIEVVEGDPTKVAVIDTGSDMPLFDLDTLRAAP